MATYEDIRGYEGIYRISSDGEVFSNHTHKNRVTEISRNGYERVCLFKNGTGTHYLVHRLVAEAFIPNPIGYECVNHKDGNKLNNDASNLEWCDASHNMRHAYRHNLVHQATKKVIQLTKDSRKVKEWNSIEDASKHLGISHGNIVTVCKQNTNRKYAGGFIWRYA
jgi:hypothetical protein